MHTYIYHHIFIFVSNRTTEKYNLIILMIRMKNKR